MNYVEIISSSALPETQEIMKINEEDFFALAGIWTFSDFTQDGFLDQAWPGRLRFWLIYWILTFQLSF